ncbi:hypothetical protein KH172YL63_34460 [Bacillus sp. KH172YL63]|nr:hypothetical protein KH172YL63_34460 [Bacillus sp. KH172YL63]
MAHTNPTSPSYDGVYQTLFYLVNSFEGGKNLWDAIIVTTGAADATTNIAVTGIDSFLATEEDIVFKVQKTIAEDAAVTVMKSLEPKTIAEDAAAEEATT